MAKHRYRGGKKRTHQKHETPRKKSFFTSAYAIIGVVATLLGLSGYFSFRDEIHKAFTPKSELFEEEMYVKGIFIPQIITFYDKRLTIAFDNVSINYPIENFKEGVEFKPKFIGCDQNRTLYNLFLKIENNRLYIKADFKDIQKEELVGKINYKYWSLKKDNIVQFKESDTHLEVKDRNDHVIFNMTYVYPSFISINGYYVDSYCRMVYVVDNGGIKTFSLEDKSPAIRAITKIKSIFVE